MADSKAESKPQKNKKPKKAKAKQRKKKPVRTMQVSGTLQFQNLVSRYVAGETSRVTTDPFDDDFSAQFARCSDTSNFQLTAAQVCKMQDHSRELVAADSDFPLRYCWIPPLQSTMQGQVEKTIADARGQFVDITHAVLKIRNASPVEVKFRGNTPKAPMYQQYDTVLRSHEFKRTIQPGATLSHTIKWSNSKRDSPHFTACLGKESKSGISLVDFYALMPDVDPEANEKWVAETTVLDITVEVHYQVETSVPEGATITSTHPFMLATLGNFYNMFYVENEITGIYSGASRRQLLSDGIFISGKAQLTSGFTIDGYTWPAGEYYVLYQGALQGAGAPKPIVVPGSIQGSILQLPTNQSGTVSSRVDDKKSRMCVTDLAINIGNASAKLATGVPGQGASLSGSMWVLVSSAGEPLSGISYTTATPGGNVPSEFFQLMGNSLLVNYWPEWNMFVPKRLSAKHYFKNMQEVGLSLMTVILVVEAAYKIISVLRGAKQAVAAS